MTQTMVLPIQGELPTLLRTSIANAGWVVTVALLAAAVATPISGRMADMFGKQPILVASSLLMAVGSVVCAASVSLAPMLVGRGLQGMAMGFIPVGIALMREVTPPRITNTAVAAMSATLGVGGAIGLPLSAWIRHVADWHAIFWTSGLLAVLTALSVAFLVPRARDASGGRFDVVGALGLAFGLVALLVGVTKGNDWGWSNPTTWGLSASGLVLLLMWVIYELRRRDPLVDIRITARRPVLLTNLAAVAVGLGMMAQWIVVPQLLQSPEATGFGLGQPQLQAGLWMAPSGVMMLVISPVSSWLMTVIGAKRTLTVGATALGLGYLAAFSLMSSPWQLLIGTCATGAGTGIAYAAMPTLIMEAVPVTEAGSAVGINALTRSIGVATAGAVMTTVLMSSTGALGLPTRTAFQACFLIGAIASFAGVAITAFVPHVHVRSWVATPAVAQE